MRHYTQLTKDQRYQISAFLKTGYSQSEIAKEIRKSKSTISRELKRNTGRRGYRPKQADQRALSRRDKAKPRIRPEDWEMIEQLVRQDWSPEQIHAQVLTVHGLQVSHEWIYQHILRIKKWTEICINICVVRKSGVNAMENTIAEAVFLAE